MGRIGGLALVLFATLAALTAFVVVAARTVEQGDRALGGAELDFVLGETEQTIERNLQLGLPLAELQQVEPLLERALAHAQSVIAADVFSQNGTTLFSTDRGAVGEPVPEAWREAIANRRTHQSWQAEEPQTMTIGRPLANDFNHVEGWVALIVDRASLAAPLSLLGPLLAQNGVIIALAGLAALILGAVLIPRRDAAILAAHAAILAKEPPRDAREPIGASAGVAIARVREAEAVLDTAAGELQRLDEEV
ncbi:hypothetical protein L1787_19935 [Acuticoccus sp. M5D2P5]|uniref:hypothetical protein n=1 Tax=Acuticoccus kalidii TaxID=2910977 RepID=UPI001F3AF447|nr:hypothetical protein [Acuticoccus kalidii]MCF3935668.1 hypothetical protein [Acuticoccus kalidii]